MQGQHKYGGRENMNRLKLVGYVTLAIGVGIMSIVMNAFKDKPTTLKPIDKENQRREYTTNNFER